MGKQFVVGSLIALALVACGGGKKADTTPEGGLPGRDYDNQPQNDGGMVPPETMEEITNLLNRKQRIMSRCLADAVDSKDLPRNSRGRITLEIVISPSGSPDTVKVIKSSLESPKLTECVVGHVKTIVFPTLPKAYPTSHTYAFEAM